jgi:hypothetical protein
MTAMMTTAALGQTKQSQGVASSWTMTMINLASTQTQR